MNRLARLFFVGAGLLATSRVYAWVDSGHMVVAAIAQRDLDSTAQKEVARLLAIGGTARTDNFITAACWADDVRPERRESAPWHYTNIHFRQDRKRVTTKTDPDNVLLAIQRFSTVLADRTKPDLERADALRFLIHFVGDVHQPLHAVARDSDAHPTGDRGGNDFKILPPTNLGSVTRMPTNLHSLWDLGCGLFPNVARPLSPDGLKLITAQADAIRATLPRRSLRQASVTKPSEWAAESFKEAKSSVYALTEDAVPDGAYLTRGREVSSTRVALAGYRLADLLNKLLSPQK